MSTDVSLLWRDVIDDETATLYHAYDRERYLGERPVVLAIDLYRLAFQGGSRDLRDITREHPSSCGRYAWDALEPTKRLLHAARARGVAVYFTSSNPAGGDGRHATMRQRGRGRSEEDFAIMDGLREPGETIVYKDRASAFFGTQLAAMLHGAQVDTIIMVGETTSGCVRASAVDGYSHGFHVVIVPECCFDRSQVSHQVALFDLHHKYADVMAAEDVVAGLAGVTPSVEVS